MTHTRSHHPLATRPRDRRVRALAALLGLGLGLGVFVAAGPASSQAPPATLGQAITEWVRGNWASPVYCRIDGDTVRGIRRVLVSPARDALPGRTELELQFIDMQVDDADRCFDVIGNEIPNLTGRIQLRFNGTSHSETVRRDFERALKRDRGFAFDVVEGHVKAQIVSSEDGREEVVDLKGAPVWIRIAAPGTDAARALAEFASPRKLELEITPSDGPTWRLPLFLTERR